MDGNDIVTGMSVVRVVRQRDGEEEENISTVGDSSVVKITWNQKVKLLDDKCLFGESEKLRLANGLFVSHILCLCRVHCSTTV